MEITHHGLPLLTPGCGWLMYIALKRTCQFVNSIFTSGVSHKWKSNWKIHKRYVLVLLPRWVLHPHWLLSYSPSWIFFNQSKNQIIPNLLTSLGVLQSVLLVVGLFRWYIPYNESETMFVRVKHELWDISHYYLPETQDYAMKLHRGIRSIKL